jgi:hypothetical protein
MRNKTNLLIAAVIAGSAAIAALELLLFTVLEVNRFLITGYVFSLIALAVVCVVAVWTLRRPNDKVAGAQVLGFVAIYFALNIVTSVGMYTMNALGFDVLQFRWHIIIETVFLICVITMGIMSYLDYYKPGDDTQDKYYNDPVGGHLPGDVKRGRRK